MTRLFNLTIWQPHADPEKIVLFHNPPGGHSRRETFLYFILESHLAPPPPFPNPHLAVIPCSEWKTSRSVDAIIADVESKNISKNFQCNIFRYFHAIQIRTNPHCSSVDGLHIVLLAVMFHIALSLYDIQALGYTRRSDSHRDYLPYPWSSIP